LGRTWVPAISNRLGLPFSLSKKTLNLSPAGRLGGVKPVWPPILARSPGSVTRGRWSSARSFSESSSRIPLRRATVKAILATGNSRSASPILAGPISKLPKNRISALAVGLSPSARKALMKRSRRPTPKVWLGSALSLNRPTVSSRVCWASTTRKTALAMSATDLFSVNWGTISSRASAGESRQALTIIDNNTINSVVGRVSRFRVMGDAPESSSVQGR